MRVAPSRFAPDTIVTASFGWFLLAGAVGFLVDAAILTLLLRLAGLPLLAARGISFACAATVTWLINRNAAFAGRARPAAEREYAGYLTIQVLGALINLAVFALCILLMPGLISWPVVPLAAGAAVALLFNFIITHSMLYAGRGSRASPRVWATSRASC